MGRCRYIDEHDRPTGMEHPWAFTGHRRLLEVWKGHAVPQPATFWTRAVWERCGPLDVDDHLVLDYDFFCRVSRHYRLHGIDQVLANYRLHAASKTCQARENQVLEAAIRASRKYWRTLPPLDLVRLLGSYLSFRIDRRPRALRLLRKAGEFWRGRHWKGLILRLAVCMGIAPDAVVDAVLSAWLPRWPAWPLRLDRILRLVASRPARTDTLAYREWRVLYPDGWAGPICTLPLQVKPGDRRAELDGSIDIGQHPQPLEIELRLEGRSLGRHQVGRRRTFHLVLPLDGLPPGEHTLEVRSSTYLVPHHFLGNRDSRPLAFRLRQLRAAREANGSTTSPLATVL